MIEVSYSRVMSLVAVFAVSLLLESGCGRRLALLTAPDKTSKPSSTELAEKAKRVFWENLHAGSYDQLPETLKLLTAAYLENPRDAQIALLLAHSHLWKVSERFRESEQDPRITDSLVLADKYFTEALRLNPHDARILGWLGGVKLALGRIHADEKLSREGYYMLLDGIDRFPEFNYFSACFVLSGLPGDGARFKEGVAYAWKNLDACIDEKINRRNPSYSRYLRLETRTGPKRVCWNSWIAPHNFEGFFLNMGDMLTKNGDVETAMTIYENARLSKGYESWKYKPVLEARIIRAGERAKLYRRDSKNPPEIMFNSAYACVGCHAK